MQSRTTRALIAVAALVAVVVLFVVLAGGDDEGSNDTTTATSKTATTQTQTTTTTRTVTAPPVERIVVEGGEPRGGVKRLSFDSGERVRFSVTSDVADEVHVHGYDLSEEVPAGGTVRFGFPASIEGVFEVELEGRGVQIAELRVSP